LFGCMMISIDSIGFDPLARFATIELDTATAMVITDAHSGWRKNIVKSPQRGLNWSITGD
jgi:hypothetical protein